MFNIGRRIKELREERGMSQSRLGKLTGIKREYICRIETDDLRNPTHNILQKIVTAFGITFPTFYGGVDKHAVDEDFDAVLAQATVLREANRLLVSSMKNMLDKLQFELDKLEPKSEILIEE